MAPRQNRHILRELCPPWLRGPQAYSFLNGEVVSMVRGTITIVRV